MDAKPRNRKQAWTEKYRTTYNALVTAFGEVCWYCGSRAIFYGENEHVSNGLHLDHIVPKSHEGGDELTNLALCCPPCNRAKLNLSAEEFIRYLNRVRLNKGQFDPNELHPLSNLRRNFRN